jgi:anti-anti-sigma factor
MNLDISALGDTAFGIRVHGEVDTDTVGRLEEFIDSLGKTDDPIVIEASGIEFIDSSGLRLFLKLAGRAGGDLSVVIRNPSRPVRHVLEISVPDGVRGMAVDFDGAGPGAAHRLSELLRSVSQVRSTVTATFNRSLVVCEDARAARSRHRRVQRTMPVRRWTDRRPRPSPGGATLVA